MDDYDPTQECFNLEIREVALEGEGDPRLVELGNGTPPRWLLSTDWHTSRAAASALEGH